MSRLKRAVMASRNVRSAAAARARAFVAARARATVRLVLVRVEAGLATGLAGAFWAVGREALACGAA